MRPALPTTKMRQPWKLQTNISHEHRGKNPQKKYEQTEFNNIQNELYTKIKRSLSHVCISKLFIWKSNVIHHIKKLKKKYHLSVDEEKTCGKKIQGPFMMETFSKLGREGNFFNFIRNLNKNSTANIILNSEKLQVFPLRSGTKVRIFPTLTTVLTLCSKS